MADEFQHGFISYGRIDSKTFATNLYQHLSDLGFQIWIDHQDIPLAVDFQDQIENGIERSDNFIFIISPHSVNSIYCLREIEHALKYHKRIIPILHVEQISQDTWQQRHPQGNASDWDAYQAQGLHSCFPNMHPAIARINWIYLRQGVDDFEQSFTGLVETLERHKAYVRQHTLFLNRALEWERHRKETRYLLIGEDRQQAEAWLKTRFHHEQPPCIPTDLHCEFITESTKNAHNLMTQVFLAHAEQDSTTADQVRRSLMRDGLTVWTSQTDIQTGTAFQEAIQRGIEEADNVVYLLSPAALQSQYCQFEIDYALALNKRIIPVLVKDIDPIQVPERLRELQYIDLTDNLAESDYLHDESQLLRILRQDAPYYEAHKMWLTRALRWQRQQQNPTILLRGYNLRHAETWLKVSRQRPQHPPTALIEAFIVESLRHPPGGALDVFISYSRADSDFARQLNDALQFQGKRTWFDQESIASGADFQQEIFRGIEASDHFLFIISPSSIHSPYCAGEVEYARKLNKRMVTVLHRPVDPADLHPLLAAVQWIDFSQPEADFSTNFSSLIRSLDTDRTHLNAHTRLLMRAIEWDTAGRKESLLLRGDDLEGAETWLAQSASKEPKPTDLHASYITSSRAVEAANQRATQILQRAAAKGKQRVLIGTTVMAIGLVVAGMAGFFAYQASEQAKAAGHQEKMANQRAGEAEKQAQMAHRQTGQANRQLAQAVSALRQARQQQKMAEQQVSLAGQRLQLATMKTAQAEQQLQQAQQQVQVAQISLQQTQAAKDKALVAQREAQQGTRLERAGASALQQFEVQQLDGLFTAVETAEELQTTVKARPLADYPAFNPIFALQTILDNIRERNRISAHQGQVLSVSFLPEGQRLVTTGNDQLVRVWTLAGHKQAEFSLGQLEVWSVSVSPNGRRVAAIARNGNLHLWTIREPGSRLLPTTPPVKVGDGSFAQVRFSPDGNQVATLGRDGILHWWNLDGTHLRELKTGGTNFSFSPDGKQVAIASQDGILRLWNLATRTPEREFETQHQPVLSIQFNPAGTQIMTGGRDGMVRLWNLDGQLVDEFKTRQAFIISLGFSPDGNQLATADSQGMVRLWTLRKRPFPEFATQQARVLSVGFSPSQQLLTATGGDRIQVWSLTGQLQRDLRVSSHVMTVSASPDGKTMAIATDNGRVQLLDLSGNALSQPFQAHQGNIFSIRFSPDGRQLVTAGLDGTVRLWSLAGQSLAQIGQPQSGAFYSASFSPDGQSLLTAGEDGMIRWWTMAGKLLNEFNAHQGNKIWSVGISPDGQRFVTASQDGTVRLWSLTKHLLAEFRFPQQTLSVEFSPDGRQIAAGSEDGRVRFIAVETLTDLLSRGCHWLSHYLNNPGRAGNRPVCPAMPIRAAGT
ncbi:TIR domain-containing protein [Leptothermofonsia sichuanensis E412]|uniref:TIR domain-containing protein n=1 Tax=Leptothermofonsia sichuanensis TaxID=2917832 RepID=UPI001CA6E4AC|nr:TIR domain-containing protein [Leptothermofonsia sichuanensis]QZZ23279.1 TIR domain-containing protein [Leptothermofonsia sichuanensis E412]